MKRSFVALCLVLMLSGTAAANEWWLTLGGGKTHIFKYVPDDSRTGMVQFGLIFPQLDQSVLVDIRPVVVVEETFGRSWLIALGLLVDFNVDPVFKISIGLGGGWWQRGKLDHLNLGFPFLFRETVELSFLLFHGLLRLTFGLEHLSNAGLGKSPSGSIINPGTESLFMSIGLPLDGW